MSRTVSRNRRSAKKAGTAFETAVCEYLRWALDDQRIQRLRLHGAKDIGDIGNVYWHGELITIECKNTSRKNYGKHLREALTEAGNADSRFAFVVQKIPGIGIGTRESMGKQLVYADRETVVNMVAISETGWVRTATMPPIKPVDEEIVWRPFHQQFRGVNPMWVTLREFALILNDFLPLGPDDTETTSEPTEKEPANVQQEEAYEDIAGKCHRLLARSGSMPVEGEK